MKHSKLYYQLKDIQPYAIFCALALACVFYMETVSNKFEREHPIKYQVISKLGPVVTDRGMTEIQRDLVVNYGMQIRYVETGKLATQWTADKSMYDAIPLNTTLTANQLTRAAYDAAGYTNLPWVMDSFLIFLVLMVAAGVAIHFALKWVVNKIEAAVWPG